MKMIKFRNESKMKSYLSERLDRAITNEEFEDCKDYMIEMLEYIKETRENECLIREEASIELEIDDEDYEVWVIFDTVIENGKEVNIIDFNYDYEKLSLF